MSTSCINPKPVVQTPVECVYLNLETPSDIQVIDSHECIGDSLEKINTNFAKLTSIGLNVLSEKCAGLFLSSLTEVSSINANKCIGNSLADINSNFLALSSFINEVKCYCCDGLLPTTTILPFSTTITMFANGNLYCSDSIFSSIFKIDSAGSASLLAGSPLKTGNADGIGQNAEFFGVDGLCANEDDGCVYACDRQNNRIRKIDSLGNVTTFAGTGPIGASGWLKDGHISSAQFVLPYAIRRDSSGNFYILESVGASSAVNVHIRKIDVSGNVTTIDTGMLEGSVGNFALDSSDMFYFSSKVGVIKQTSAGEYTLIAELSSIVSSETDGYVDGAGNNHIRDIVIDPGGIIFVADMENHRIRKIDSSGNVTTYAGSGPTGLLEGGFADGNSSVARFDRPAGLCLDPNGSGDLYVNDYGNKKIRKIDTSGNVTTFCDYSQVYANITPSS